MLFILLFWTPITAEFETMKKHTATAWANTRVETVKVPATPPVCTEAKGHVHCPRALLVGRGREYATKLEQHRICFVQAK